MNRSIMAALLALSLSVANAQTILRISNLTITEKENTKNGTDIMVDLKGAEGSERSVIYADHDFTL